MCQKETDNLRKEHTKNQTKITKLTKDIQQKASERNQLEALKERQYRLMKDKELLFQKQLEDRENKELEDTLRRSVKGFKGSLGSLTKPIEEKFNIALRLALGSALNYLVVDNAETAATCSNILKDKGVMRELLVLDNIPLLQAYNISAVRGQLGRIGYMAFDVLEYDKRIMGLEGALKYLLGGKVVCESLA